jgi:broad specificity phosphatase PhoE
MAGPIATAIAEGLGRRQPVEAVYAGPETINTAKVIAEHLGLAAPEVRFGLKPASFEGASAASLAEAIDAASEDVWSVVEELRDAHPEDAQVVAVTDTISAHAAVSRALGLRGESHERFRLEPGSLSAIAFRQQRTILALLNERCRLNVLDT